VRICPFTPRAVGADCTEMMHEPRGGRISARPVPVI
jgi:hypothetical protein